MLEHFCTVLHGFVAGAFIIDILQFLETEIDGHVKLIIKIPFECIENEKIQCFKLIFYSKRTIFLQSIAMADIWRNERCSMAVEDSSPFLIYL